MCRAARPVGQDRAAWFTALSEGAGRHPITSGRGGFPSVRAG
jgi:hypothetical protein